MCPETFHSLITRSATARPSLSKKWSGRVGMRPQTKEAVRLECSAPVPLQIRSGGGSYSDERPPLFSTPHPSANRGCPSKIDAPLQIRGGPFVSPRPPLGPPRAIELLARGHRRRWACHAERPHLSAVSPASICRVCHGARPPPPNGSLSASTLHSDPGVPATGRPRMGARDQARRLSADCPQA
jgi:hypothetical protein